MGRNKRGAKREERRRKKQNNVTEADQEKEDGAQSVIESTTDSVGTEATSSRENRADCEDLKVGIQESREEQIAACHPIPPSGDSGIDNSLAAGSSPTYDTPTTPTTSPYPILPPENMRLCRRFRDIGIVVQAMDNDVRGLEIKALAELIYTRPGAVSVIEGIIHDHALKRGQEKVSDDLRALTMRHGDISTDVVGHEIKALIERILNKAELTIDKLTFLLDQDEKSYLYCHSGVVRLMLQIRNRVVHQNFEFIGGEEKQFLKLYKQYIQEILGDVKLQLDRYLQLEATSKDFETIVKGWNKMVERCRASYEDECRKLKKEIGRLKNLVETYEEANYLQEIFSLRKQVADLVEENMELKRNCKCSKDAVPADIPVK